MLEGHNYINFWGSIQLINFSLCAQNCNAFFRSNMACGFQNGMSIPSCSGVLYAKPDSSLERLLTTLALCTNLTNACTTSDMGGRNSGSGYTEEPKLYIEHSKKIEIWLKKPWHLKKCKIDYLKWQEGTIYQDIHPCQSLDRKKDKTFFNKINFYET